MPRSSSPSIRTILGTLAVACILPVTSITVGLLWSDYQRDQAQLLDNTISTSRSLIGVVDQVFAGTEASLRTLQTSASLWDPDRSSFDAQARAISQEQSESALILTDANGKELVNTLVPFGQPLAPYSDPAQVARLALTHATVVSGLYRSRVDNVRVTAVGVPVLRGGQHAYDLFCQLLPSAFSNLLSQQSLPPGYVAAITDGSGTIVARSRENDKFVGTTVSRDLLNALLIRPEGSVSGKTLDGVPVVAGYSQSQKTGWTVVIAIPHELLTRDLHRRIAVLASLTLLSLVIGLGAAWLIGTRIIQAHRGLIAPALAVGKGEPATVPTFSFREANEVGEALRKASEMLSLTQHKANHDTLTGLPNRGLFYEVLARQLRIAARNRTRVSILFIDLDGFKAINDQLGHAAGDDILRQVAARLRELLRASDMPSRLGGDEFAVALPDTDARRAEAVAAKLIDALSQPYVANVLQPSVSASIGIAVSRFDNVCGEALVRAADDAMYVAKEAGKARFHVSQSG